MLLAERPVVVNFAVRRGELALEVVGARDFTLDDFRRELDRVEKTGTKVPLGRLPDLWALGEAGEDRAVVFARVRRVVDAMTANERRNPDGIDESGMAGIAARSGTQPVDVAKVLAQFYQVRAFMRRMASLSFWQRIKLVLGFGKFPGPEEGPK